MEGIVYKTLDYKEKSKLVYLLTPTGLDSVIARGAKDYKKGLLGFISPLTLVTYERTNAKLPSLISYEILGDFKALKENIIKYNCALSILEIARQSTDSRTERIYDFTLLALKELAKTTVPLDVLFIYLTKMLKVFGIFNVNLDIKFKAELKEKVLAAYNGNLQVEIAATNEDIKHLIWYYDELGAIYTYNIKQAMVR